MIDYDNFQKSLKNLEIQNRYYKEMDKGWPEWIKEGIAESVIQRFEICYDCLWKVLKQYIKETEGITESLDSPKKAFRQASKLGFFTSPLEQWFQYVDARIDTTHDYSGEKAQDAIELMDDFIDDAIGLYQTMSDKTWE